jgi:hypothetical protein
MSNKLLELGYTKYRTDMYVKDAIVLQYYGSSSQIYSKYVNLTVLAESIEDIDRLESRLDFFREQVKIMNSDLEELKKYEI